MKNNELHPCDIEYFKEFPSPMMEAMTRLATCEINGTCPHYAPFLYCVGKMIGSHYSLEIGTAQGYTSGYMAWAIRENNTRFAANGRHYSIDILDRSPMQADFDAMGLPASLIQHEKGSLDWLKNNNIFAPESLDLVFIDGLHYDPYLKAEVELIYPLLKGNGNGYMALHDTSAFVELADKDIRENPKYQWESIRFINNYGLTLYRKMDGLDRNKRFWPSGDQTDIAKQMGLEL